MQITVQYQEPRKPHRWIDAFTARVLYADRKIVLVRGCGSHSTFRTDGTMKHVGWHPDRAEASHIPTRTGTWRLRPHSVARLAKRKHG
jgi:hypothetical protein